MVTQLLSVLWCYPPFTGKLTNIWMAWRFNENSEIKKYAFLKEQIIYHFHIQEGGERCETQNSTEEEREEHRSTTPDRKSEAKYKMLELYSFLDRVYTWWSMRVRRETSEEDRGFQLPLKWGRKTEKAKGETNERLEKKKKKWRKRDQK